MSGANKGRIYLDNAASTRVSERVKQTIYEVLDDYGNPSSLHEEGQKARRHVLDAQSKIANKFNCLPDEIHFTTGATMSNNLFIQGFLRKHSNASLVVTTIEHNDIIELMDYLDDKVDIKRIGVGRDGALQLDALEEHLRTVSKRPVLCICQWANGECGTIQDMTAISRIVHGFEDCYLYVDATQYAPYYPIDLRAIQIDGMGLSGQKLHCVKGTGILYVHQGVEISPLIFGEQGLIGGTENVVGIAAIGTAIDELNYEVGSLIEKRDYVIDGLRECGKVIGSLDNRLPNNVYICFENIDAEFIVVLLDTLGISVSAGSACGSRSEDGSHVVRALGYTPKESQSCVRFTLSDENTYSELDDAIKIVKEIIYF